jgi:hypothetical protein
MKTNEAMADGSATPRRPAGRAAAAANPPVLVPWVVGAASFDPRAGAPGVT